MSPFILPLALLLLPLRAANVPSSVIQLSGDKFVEVKDDGFWFVKLYAPWCAHCKRLAPVWEHVAHHIADKNGMVRVAKLDCTLYQRACQALHITAYPTILFFRNGHVVTYEGDRERDAMVDFALKCASPTVSPLQHLNHYNEVKTKSRLDPAFLFVESDGAGSDEVRNAFQLAADSLFSFSRFYSIPAAIAPSALKAGHVYVLRDQSVEEFEGEADDISEWAASERFPLLARVSSANLPQLAATGKLIVMTSINQVDKKNPSTPSFTLYAEVEEAAKEARKDKHMKKSFQFAYTDGNALASGIAMQSLPIPNVLVLNYSSYEFFLPVDEGRMTTRASLLLWLREGVLGGQTTPGGGRALSTRLHRLVYEMYTNVVQMFTTQPLLSSCIFGVPLAFLSIITYSLCSADFSVDRDEIYPDEEEEEEEGEGEEEEEHTQQYSLHSSDSHDSHEKAD